MIIKEIPSSWLVEEEHRLDCGPFVKGGIEARKTIEGIQCKKQPLVDLTYNGINGIYHVGQEKIIWAKDSVHGMPFLRSGDILRSDLSCSLKISKKQVAKNPLFQCPEGSTLITRSGTIGRMVYMKPHMVDMAISQDVLKVVPDSKKIDSGYLYAFLSSKYGIPIITGGTFGSIIVHIEAENIAHLPVPRLGKVENEAHKLVKKSSALFVQYHKAINSATQLLFNSINLKDITASEWHSWGSDLGFKTIIKNQTSFRALNYNPRFFKLVKRIKKGPWKALRDICIPGTLKRGGRYRRVDADPEHSYLMIGQKQIFWTRPEGRWIAKSFVGDDVIVKPGVILIAGAGTLADSELYSRCEFIWGEAEKRAYSELFYRVEADENIMLPGALFAFMRSETAFRMLRSISFGSKLQYPHLSFLSEIPVPYPDKEIRNEIHKMVISAYDMKDKAINLEDQAKTLVEEAIKSGGS